MLRLEQPGNLRRLLLWDFKKRPVKLSLEGFASKGGCGFRMWTTAPFFQAEGQRKRAAKSGPFVHQSERNPLPMISLVLVINIKEWGSISLHF